MRALNAIILLLSVLTTSAIAENPRTTAPREVYAGQDVVLSRPRLEYPPGAREHQLQGSGMYVLLVDARTGNVRRVIIERSTGNKVLDAAAVANLRQWRYKTALLRLLETRNGPSGIQGVIVFKVPITFHL